MASRSSRKPDWAPAIRHLSKDPILRKVIQKVGPCALAGRRDYFVVLCKSIYSQQVSTTVAATLFKRFRNQFLGKRPTPSGVIRLLGPKADELAIRVCGLSRQKRAYLVDLAKHFSNGSIPTKKFARMDDEEIIESLTKVHGVGRWTAEMFLIFVLNRTDLLPVDDLGLREGVRKHYKLKERPTKEQVTRIAEKWKPYRSIATWYIWRGS